MKVNGEAIHGTGLTPFGAEAGEFDPVKRHDKVDPKKIIPPDSPAYKDAEPVFNPTWVWRCTTKPGKLYLHIFQWPKNGKFEIPAVQEKITKAYLLADPQKAGLKLIQSDSGVSIALPEKAPIPSRRWYAWKLKTNPVSERNQKMKTTTAAFAIASLLLGMFPLHAEPAETKEQRDARMSWWREARFGMFIHWNVSAVPAGFYQGKPTPTQGTKGFPFAAEWIMLDCRIPVAEYKAFAKDFNPVQYNAEEWVKLAKEAGMKYIVITAKHHDGFAMFDTKASDWNIIQATLMAKIPSKTWPRPAANMGCGSGSTIPRRRIGSTAARPTVVIGTRRRTAIWTTILTRSPFPKSASFFPTMESSRRFFGGMVD